MKIPPVSLFLTGLYPSKFVTRFGSMKRKVNLEKLFLVRGWLKFFILEQPEIFFLFTKFRQFLELALIVNIYVTLYWFFIHTFHIYRRIQLLTGCPKNRYSQSFSCEGWVTHFIKLARWRATNVLIWTPLQIFYKIFA